MFFKIVYLFSWFVKLNWGVSLLTPKQVELNRKWFYDLSFSLYFKVVWKEVVDKILLSIVALVLSIGKTI